MASEVLYDVVPYGPLDLILASAPPLTFHSTPDNLAPTVPTDALDLVALHLQLRLPGPLSFQINT